MNDKTVLLRCRSCGTLNRLPADRIFERPKCGRCKNILDFPKAPVEVTGHTFEEEVLKWPGSVLVEFWSPQCGICTAIEPFIGKIASQKAGRLKVAMINIAKEWLLANRFDIRSTPVFLVYKNGKKVDELYGALPKLQLEAWIESATGG
ncbi:MAG TPA: thioredoxin domain-containing protein [Thermodesulfovibrionales bacterium]|nr:thioredoxin domain-containing protein [Thermodesulfovibrionales bacterium]